MDELRVVGLVQRMNFDTGVLEFFASVSLLGRAHDVPITEEEFGALVAGRLEKAADPPPVEEARAPAAPAVPGLQERLEESSATTLDWTKLPSGVLSDRYRRALTALNIPPLIQAERLQELLQQLEAEFTPDDWAAVGVGDEDVPEAPAPPAPPPAPATSTLGMVTWSDGAPVMPQARPARTVPKDDWGYPVTGSGVDPSAAVGGGENTDEDGIGQF